MITIDRTAPPYLFTGAILGSASIITFSKEQMSSLPAILKTVTRKPSKSNHYFPQKIQSIKKYSKASLG